MVLKAWLQNRFPQQRVVLVRHEITVRYDGPAVEHGWMNATEVGSAMLGLGNMVSGASNVLLGDSATVEARVRSDFKGGSFEVVFEIVALADHLFHSDAAENIMALLGVYDNTQGLIQVLRWLRGRSLTREERDEAGVTLVAGRDRLELRIENYQVLRSKEIRDGLAAFVHPLWNDGVSRLSLTSGATTGKAGVVIEAAEREHMVAPVLPSETVDTSRSTLFLTVVAPVFEGDYVWRFAQGDTRYTARMEDLDFLEKVRKGDVEFGHGHALRVIFETDTIDQGAGLAFRHRVVKVLGHIRPQNYRQGDML